MRNSRIRSINPISLSILASSIVVWGMIRKISLEEVYRDQGIFLYTSYRILKGEFPYADSWDHKGPVTYLIDSLWIYLGNGVANAALIEAIILGLAIFGFVFYVSSNTNQNYLHGIVLMAFLYFMSVFHESWGITETLSIPFVLLGGLMTLVIVEKKDTKEALVRRTLTLLLGTLFFIIFFMRPTNAMGFIFFTLFVVLYFSKKRFETFLFYSFGFLFPSCVLLLWLHSGNATDDFWEQFIVYNYYYSKDVSLIQKISSIENAIPLLIATLLVIGFLYRMANKSKYNLILIIVGVISIILDILGASFSGRGYKHYFVTPATSFYMCLTVLTVLLNLRHSQVMKLLTVSIFVITSMFTIASLQKISHPIAGNQYSSVVSYLMDNSNRGDKIYIYGAESGILALSDRESASSFSYIYPATSLFYPKAKQTGERILQDLIDSPPKFVVSRLSSTCPVEAEICTDSLNGYSDNKIKAIRKHLRDAYELEYEIGDFRVYVPKG